MESNWFEQFLNNDGEKKINPIVLIFIFLQVVFFVIIGFVAMSFNNENEVEDDAMYYERMPEFIVENLVEEASVLEEDEVTDIQKKIFKIVSENTNSVNVDKIKATIRDDSLHIRSFGDDNKYLNMVIDIPSLEQSYEVFYGSNAIIDPEVSTFVLCLDDENIIYKSFKCKSSDDESMREEIAAAYLDYFDFDYFSAYLNLDDPDTVIISPAVTYDNDEVTKTRYINEVKAAIESLGLSSDSFEYYVRTAADVNYDNPD